MQRLGSYPSVPNTQPRPAVIPRRWLGRGLLGVWLLYSAIALGWFLSQDPLLSQYICGVR